MQSTNLTTYVLKFVALSGATLGVLMDYHTSHQEPLSGPFSMCCFPGDSQEGKRPIKGFGAVAYRGRKRRETRQ